MTATTTSGHSFKLTTASGDLSGNCLIEENEKGMKLLGGVSMSRTLSKIGRACENSAGKSETVLSAGNDSKYEGTVTIPGGEYTIKAIYEAEGSFSTGNPTGYRVDGETIVAATDVMNPGRIWLGKALESADKDNQTRLFTGLMLYTGKKD